MTVFVDTSAFYALLVRNDDSHTVAGETWAKLIASRDDLVTSNYVELETCALLRNRVGMEAVRRFEEDLLPVVTVEYVDRTLHATGLASMMTAGRAGPSLVDCVSIALMRKMGISRAFAFDKHFDALDGRT